MDIVWRLVLSYTWQFEFATTIFIYSVAWQVNLIIPVNTRATFIELCLLE